MKIQNRDKEEKRQEQMRTGIEKQNNGDKPEKELTSDLDWDKRILCEDGNCIGVIGPDGFCKECGRPYQGHGSDDFPRRGSDFPDSVSEEEHADDSNAEEPVAEDCEEGERAADIEQLSQKTVSDLEWENRKLCSDGNCIGVIGPDGLCKECGKPCEKDA